VIRPIQYLRGIAAMMVVWVHVVPLFPSIEARLGDPHWGTAGVDLFFVISGFIMVVSTEGKSLTPWQFFENRLVRIVPLYWLVTGVMIAKAVSRHQAAELHYTAATIGQSLAFIPYHSLEYPGRIWPILLQGWTLNYEMFFYALFALSFVLGKRLRVPVLVGSLALLVGVGSGGPFSSAAAAIYTDPRLLEFGAGMLIAKLWLYQQLKIGVVASGLAIGAGFYFLTFLESPWLLLAGAACVVVGSLGPAAASIRSRLLLELGNASYSIYLTHIFLFGAVRAIGRHLPAAVSLPMALGFVTAALAICAGAGWLCYRFIEKPTTQWLHLAASGRRRASLGGPSSVAGK
jgi:exopolysaccharide production protein ExoZ